MLQETWAIDMRLVANATLAPRRVFNRLTRVTTTTHIISDLTGKPPPAKAAKNQSPMVQLRSGAAEAAKVWSNTTHFNTEKHAFLSSDYLGFAYQKEGLRRWLASQNAIWRHAVGLLDGYAVEAPPLRGVLVMPPSVRLLRRSSPARC